MQLPSLLGLLGLRTEPPGRQSRPSRIVSLALTAAIIMLVMLTLRTSLSAWVQIGIIGGGTLVLGLVGGFVLVAMDRRRPHP